MLQQFSWGHFLLASILLNLVWYGFVLLVFYRKEVLAFLGSREGSSAFTTATNPKGHYLGQSQNLIASQAGETVEVSVMGGSRLPEGVEVLSSSQVAFSGGDSGDRYDQVGLVADVVQELKLVFSKLEDSGGGKTEFLRRVSQIKEDLGGLAGHPSLDAINGFIRERALFPISDAELMELW